MSFNADKRPTQFPLNRTLVPDAITPDDGTPQNPLTWATNDPDEKVTITMNISLNEFVAIASSVDVGRDIAYGEDAIKIWWIWSRSIRTMELCEQVAECINENQAVKDALGASSGGSGGTDGTGGATGGGAGTPIPSAVDDTTNFLSGADCTDDNIFAVAVGIVDFSFAVVEQVYDLIELASQPAEGYAELLDNAPAVASAAPASVLDYILWIQDTADALWDAFDSQITRDEIACDLFCLMKDQECELTFDDLFAFFSQGSAIPVAGNTISDILLQLVTLNTAELVGRTSLAFMYGVLALGAQFGGLRNVGGILVRVASLWDETNNNWQQLCDPCSPCTLYDFTGGSQDGWTIEFASGTYDGSGFVGGVSIPSQSVGVLISHSVLYTGSYQVRVTYDADQATGVAGAVVEAQLRTAGGGFVSEAETPYTDGVDQLSILNVNPSNNEIWVRIVRDNSQSANLKIKKVEICLN